MVFRVVSALQHSSARLTHHTVVLPKSKSRDFEPTLARTIESGPHYRPKVPYIVNPELSTLNSKPLPFKAVFRLWDGGKLRARLGFRV